MFHDRAGGIINMQDSYPANFICNAFAPPTQETADTNRHDGRHDGRQKEEKGPLVSIPYVAGISEGIRHVCRKLNMRVVTKSGRTLCSMSKIHFLMHL